MSDTRFASYWLASCMAATVLMGMLFLRPVLGGNDGSRWNTVWSLTHGKGYVIDEAPYQTVDKVKRDGHFYSSKPPLFPTMVAGCVWFVRLLTGMDLPQDAEIIIRAMLVLINVLPFAAVIVLYGRMLERAGFSHPTCLFCLVTAAWGTYLTSYSVTLNNHTVAACACFFTLYVLIGIQCDGRKEECYFALCGLFAAWTVCNELPAAPFGLLVFLWLLKCHARETLKFFTPAAALVLLAYFFTTWLATGGVVPNYARFNSPLYFYEGSYWANPRGIDAAHDPKWFYLFNLLLGHHGIFSLSPVFLIAFYGMMADAKWRIIHRLGLLLTVTTLALYLVKTNNYGGSCHGARWFVWLIPFWLLGLPCAVERHVQHAWFRALAYPAVGISVLSAALAMMGTRGPWGTSWLHLIFHTRGWMDY